MIKNEAAFAERCLVERPRRGRRAWLCGLVVLILALAGCTSARSAPSAHAVSRSGTATVQRGEATYYGSRFAGRRTASGERFNPRALTAAHRSLPMGTKVRVTNLDNGRSVKVRINDRGPYKSNRIIDLSRRAARRLRMIHKGAVPVRLRVLDRP